VREIKILLSSVQYFTRIPMPQWVGHGGAQLTGTTRYLPAVGIAVGALAAAVFWLGSLVFPVVVAAILSTIATVALTGALHEDGLADTMDGLGGGTTRERALEIMKDPRIGAFGALGLMLMLGLKIAALSTLPAAWIVMTLIAGHALSRWCAVLMLRRLPYARTDGSTRARAVIEQVTPADILIASVFGLAPLAACDSRAWVGAAAAVVTAGLLGFWFRRRLGGYTGDTLGAAQQITEVAFYLAMLAAGNSR
jgi:adenosylcobinamide-GDP ribazoletransferase